jgi:hypothetical protein
LKELSVSGDSFRGGMPASKKTSEVKINRKKGATDLNKTEQSRQEGL